MSELDRLREEVIRLQSILDDHGIDYALEAFGPPPPPTYGPPTLWEHITATTTAHAMKSMARSILDRPQWLKIYEIDHV